MKAIAFTNVLPVQTDEGYTANLRNDHYLEIGLPSDDEARIPPARPIRRRAARRSPGAPARNDKINRRTSDRNITATPARYSS